MSGGQILDRIQMILRNRDKNSYLTVFIDVAENSLSRKWLSALENLLREQYHLEKNYCFLGFEAYQRNGQYILDCVNQSIDAINNSDIGYKIDDYFSLANTILPGPIGDGLPGGKLIREKTNALHHYFEELQGVSGSISRFAKQASPEIKWHIRQLNLLCHEFESWALSWHKNQYIPQWKRPSQLMCWLNAPRFFLDHDDYDLFGIDTINRPLGGVFVGVNKAIGKHHYEVFCDEGKHSRIDSLVTDTLRSQTEASGDFDIEWANDPGAFEFQKKQLAEFRQWLIDNGLDPEDKTLTIGHPQVAQVDLHASFGSQNYLDIWQQLNTNLDVYQIITANQRATFDYHWSDTDYADRQINIISKG